MSKRHKPYDRMTTAELREATREFDREMIDAPGKPLTAAQRKLHRDAAASAAKKRKVGRPLKGEGTTVVAVSVESVLLKKADALAKRRKVARSHLFNEALRALLIGRTGRPPAAGTRLRFWGPRTKVGSKVG